jgi:hypothetical protein
MLANRPCGRNIGTHMELIPGSARTAKHNIESAKILYTNRHNIYIIIIIIIVAEIQPLAHF